MGRLELPTLALKGRCYYQLSYTSILSRHAFFKISLIIFNKITVGVYHRTYYHHVRDFYEEQSEEVACRKKAANMTEIN